MKSLFEVGDIVMYKGEMHSIRARLEPRAYWLKYMKEDEVVISSAPFDDEVIIKQTWRVPESELKPLIPYDGEITEEIMKANRVYVELRKTNEWSG